MSKIIVINIINILYKKLFIYYVINIIIIIKLNLKYL